MLTSVAGAIPDEGTGPVVDHPGAQLAELLAHHDVHATREELRGVPYDVELGPHLLSHVGSTPPRASPG